MSAIIGWGCRVLLCGCCVWLLRVVAAWLFCGCCVGCCAGCCVAAVRGVADRVGCFPLRIIELSNPRFFELSISRIIDFSTPRFFESSNHRFLGPSISRPLVSSVSRPFFPLSLHAQFAANIQINSHTITRFLHKFHSLMHFAPY